DDCNFSKRRDVIFASTVAARWDDYSNYLKNDPEKLHYILYKYILVLRSMDKQNPGFFKDLTVDKTTNEYWATGEERKNEALLIDQFVDLVEGFKLHLAAFGKDNLSEKVGKLKESNLRAFQAALCNQIIS